MGLLTFVFVATFCTAVLGYSDTCKQNTKDLCVSPECLAAVSRIISSMDTTADPCTDMYKYSCGAWQKRVHIPETMNAVNTHTITSEENQFKITKLIEANGNKFKGIKSTAIEKLKDYFRTCMDETTISIRGRQPFIELIEKLGSWSVTTRYLSQWQSANFDLQTAMESVLKNAGALSTPPFFKFSVSYDYKNNSKLFISLYQSGTTYNSYYYYYYRSKTWLNYAANVAIFLGGDVTTAGQKLIDIFYFERNLTRIVTTQAELNGTGPSSTYHPMKVSDAQKLFGTWLDLKKYLQAAFQGKNIDDNTIINILTPTYFPRLNTLIQGTSKETLANYIVFRVLHNLALMGSTPVSALPSNYLKAALYFSGRKSMPERHLVCLKETETVLGFASSALFDDQNFTPATRKRVLDLIFAIRKEFINNMNTVSWLDNSTKANLAVKAQNIDFLVGFPSWSDNPTTLDAHYAGLKVQKGKAYENIIATYQNALVSMVDQYGKPRNKKRWAMRPDVVNAYYQPVNNQLVIPSGDLQPPMYNPLYPDPYIYGVLGSTVGHETTHGFDNKGRLYDKDGNLRNMWTQQATLGFQTAATCLANQYSNFTFQNKHLKGFQELGENIADNGGIRLAYYAMQHANLTESKLPGLNFTKEQLFFIGFSQKWCTSYRPTYENFLIDRDVHPPSAFRVQGVISNSPEFSKAFNCPSGTPMNPVNKCRVW